MLRLCSRRTLCALVLACAMAGCGVKGPLVPARKGVETGAPPPAPATTAPDIPSATPPPPAQPAP